jgi:AraC-like DNA-binding protein
MMLSAELLKLNVTCPTVDLGMAETNQELTQEQITLLSRNLRKSGLELMESKKAILIEKIKNIITEMIHYSEEELKINFSDFLAEKLDYNYTYLANVFSDVTGITIERYVIAHKIERVKELLLYDELSLTEISYKLHYTSVAHLSSQFKKVTGLTPSYFKQLKKHKMRIALEDIETAAK